MLRWLMQHKQNAARIGSANLRWHVRCNLVHVFKSELKYDAVSYDASSPVHAIQMSDANMHSIRMLIETYPKTNHCKRLNKREKDVGVEDMHHTHARLLQHSPHSEGPNK